MRDPNDLLKGLTEEQKAAVLDDSESLAVVAAAGAGKTRVLTRRYLRHVLWEGISPERLLSITFTRKAAAEMKQRIVGELREWGRDDYAQAAETGPIQTIDSFCEGLLRENALEAGLDPTFGVLEGAPADHVLESSIREAIGAAVDDPIASGLIDEIAGESGYRTRHRRLEAAAGDLIGHWRRLGLSRGEMEELHQDPSHLLKTWHRAVHKDLPDDIAKGVDPESESFFADLKAIWKRGRPAWLAARDPAIELKAAEHACGLGALACEAWRLFENRMREIQQFDFPALETMALGLIERSAHVRERVGAQFAAVLVDEAQDLNPRQHRLLDSLPVTRKLLVGDPQQSIFGWRQADARLFLERAQRGHLRLSENWRSGAEILRFVDGLFGELWAEGYQAMLPPEAERRPRRPSAIETWRLRARDSTVVAARIRELVDEGLAPGDISVLVRKASSGVRLLDDLQREGVPACLTGGTDRYYARLEVRDLANALRALADPTDDFALLASLRGPFARLSMDSLAMLAQRRPMGDALETFEPPIEDDRGRLDAFRRWFLPLRAQADRLPAWEVLARILAESGVLEAFATRPSGRRAIANARKLLLLATELPEEGAYAFARRIREIQELGHREGDAPSQEQSDLVTIMTIHKAKGLEFEAVVVTDLGEAPGANKEVAVDPETGLFTASFAKTRSTFEQVLRHRANEREDREELRLAYVAMTRAKTRLCLVMPDSSKDRAPAKRISPILKRLRASGLEWQEKAQE
ncbi:MAG: UvrD-helicase domain-containing protein [Fimbriimonas ginsengisoli]|uniref:DNA 3'-5' helicase n=1 Tax=Fimbriimonas ginsengisoli TaxID=1005039 RepID=A0A931PVP7_FIMGI|nr:UvrD-helicase domain-containing protein [Fimbriimonas ginsengisoli]MBI3721799.1 UvrD-helicase domain-containing protein [Fimbriimonas ginsengisoli]